MIHEVLSHRDVLGPDAVGLGHGTDVVLAAGSHGVALRVQGASRFAVFVLVEKWKASQNILATSLSRDAAFIYVAF